MIKALILSLFIVQLSQAQVPEGPELIMPVSIPVPVEICLPGVLPVLPFEGTATQINRNCSPLNIRARKENASGTFSYADLKSKFEDRMQSLQMHFETDTKDFCPCVKTLTFNEIKVPDELKSNFKKDHFDKAYGKTLKKALDEVLQNTTKFKNLNLPSSESNNLHDRSKSLCVPSILATQLQELKAKSGTTDCPSSPEDFSKKMSLVFGTSELSNLTSTITENNIGLNTESCISRQMYMHYRSSHQSSTYGMAHVNEAQSLKEFFHAFGKIQLPDLLSYDLFFNLGYRDNDFKNILAKKLPFGAPDTELQKVYTDPEVLSEAFTSIDNSCKKITDNLKEFICTDSVPKVSEKTLNLIANDALNTPGMDKLSKQATIDHFLNERVCNQPRELNAQDLKFDELIDSTVLQSRSGVKDILSPDPGSDYSKFNKQFCQGREGRAITPEELPSMMKEYFEKVKTKVDLAGFFAAKDIEDLLDLKVDLNKTPIFSSKTDPDKKLPAISQIAWRNKILPKLKEKGLSEDEIHQLYAIIEMQTNIRIREVREVREQLKTSQPQTSSLSDVEIDSIMRQDPASPAGSNIPGMEDMNSEIRTVYQGQRASRMERFIEAGSSQVTDEPTFKEIRTSDAPVIARISSSPDQTDTSNSGSSKTEASPKSLSVTPTPQGFTSSGISGSTPNSDSTIAERSESSFENQSQGSSDFSSKSFKNDDESSSANFINDDIQKIRDQIKASQEEYNRLSKDYNSLNQLKPSSSVRNNRPSRPRGMVNSDYKFPKNVPIKSKDGKYFVPEAGSGSELSSASEASANSRSQGASGPSGVSGSGAADGGISGAGAAALASLGGMSSKGMRGDGGRNPASLSSPIANLSAFEHPQIIPHSIFDIVGSIDKVVLLLGLEGKTFKTIEGIEEFDKETGKLKINYLQRTYDFIPQGKFSNLKERFQTKESREEAYKSLFTYPRTKENLITSKKYALATKEVAKEEVSHSYVLQIQNNILSDDEIRVTIKKVMEQIK